MSVRKYLILIVTIFFVNTGFSAPKIDRVLTSIKNKYKCSNNKKRIELMFHVKRLLKNEMFEKEEFTFGNLSGQRPAIFIGKSFLNDIIVVEKVASESGNDLGFNVNLFLCEYEPFISTKRTLSDFYTNKLITKYSNFENCSIGNVVDARGYILVDKNNGLNAHEFPLAFSPIEDLKNICSDDKISGEDGKRVSNGKRKFKKNSKVNNSSENSVHQSKTI